MGCSLQAKRPFGSSGQFCFCLFCHNFLFLCTICSLSLFEMQNNLKKWSADAFVKAAKPSEELGIKN